MPIILGVLWFEMIMRLVTVCNTQVTLCVVCIALLTRSVLLAIGRDIAGFAEKPVFVLASAALTRRRAHSTSKRSPPEAAVNFCCGALFVWGGSGKLLLPCMHRLPVMACAWITTLVVASMSWSAH